VKLSGNIMKINDLRELVFPLAHKPDAFAKASALSPHPLHAATQHAVGKSAFSIRHSLLPTQHSQAPLQYVNEQAPKRRTQ
jgi:hypothetical protein